MKAFLFFLSLLSFSAYTYTTEPSWFVCDPKAICQGQDVHVGIMNFESDGDADTIKASITNMAKISKMSVLLVNEKALKGTEKVKGLAGTPGVTVISEDIAGDPEAMDKILDKDPTLSGIYAVEAGLFGQDAAFEFASRAQKRIQASDAYKKACAGKKSAPKLTIISHGEKDPSDGSISLVLDSDNGSSLYLDDLQNLGEQHLDGDLQAFLHLCFGPNIQDALAGKTDPSKKKCVCGVSSSARDAKSAEFAYSDKSVGSFGQRFFSQLSPFDYYTAGVMARAHSYNPENATYDIDNQEGGGSLELVDKALNAGFFKEGATPPEGYVGAMPPESLEEWKSFVDKEVGPKNLSFDKISIEADRVLSERYYLYSRCRALMGLHSVLTEDLDQNYCKSEKSIKGDVEKLEAKVAEARLKAEQDLKVKQKAFDYRAAQQVVSKLPREDAEAVAFLDRAMKELEKASEFKGGTPTAYVKSQSDPLIGFWSESQKFSNWVNEKQLKSLELKSVGGTSLSSVSEALWGQSTLADLLEMPEDKAQKLLSEAGYSGLSLDALKKQYAAHKAEMKVYEDYQKAFTEIDVQMGKHLRGNVAPYNVLSAHDQTLIDLEKDRLFLLSSGPDGRLNRSNNQGLRDFVNARACETRPNTVVDKEENYKLAENLFQRNPAHEHSAGSSAGAGISGRGSSD